jgi:hypothetical protein
VAVWAAAQAVAAVAMVVDGTGVMKMINTQKHLTRSASVSSPSSAMAAGLFVLAGFTASAAQAQTAYATPTQAADALIQSIATTDPAMLRMVVGEQAYRLMGLDEASAEDRLLFLEKAAQKREIKVNGTRAELQVGNQAWTLPLPLKQSANGQWAFDASGGREAILNQRIGSNERSAIKASLAYVDAQREYASADRNGDGVTEYAQKLLSSPGKRDGLIWDPALGADSPLGMGFAPKKPGTGYHGYNYRILTAQGPNAAGGTQNYKDGARMSKGFGLIAWPVQYGQSGVMSFMVNQHGKVFERDLGPQTASRVTGINRFDPAPGWSQVQP